MDQGPASLKQRQIAELIRSHDFNAARTLLLATLQTHPRLDNALEMLTALEVLCAVEKVSPGRSIDWCKVLQVLPTDNFSVIEARYKNIMDQLQPVKDDIPGAGLAVQYAMDGYAILCSRAKKNAPDCAATTEINKADAKRQKTVSIAADAQKLEVDDDRQYGSAPNSDLPGNVAENETFGLSAYDFYDFQSDREFRCFAEGQIWVAYDWEKMPRRYAEITEVVPDKMQLCVTWFRPWPKSPRDNHWCSAGLPMVCGTFGAESKASVIGPTMFSHLLPRGLTNRQLEVYPKKGEVWAIYRDWDVEWCSDPSLWKNGVLLIVEILSDFLEHAGVFVGDLIKVAGFKNVFKRRAAADAAARRIDSDKLLVFSHMIPSFRFSGSELNGIAVGMFELEPSAVPKNLDTEILGMPTVFDMSAEIGSLGGDSLRPELNAYITSRHAVTDRPPPEKLQEEQVWAVYDDRVDGMPRSYVKVIKLGPQNVEANVSYLEPHPMLDQEIRWVEDGLPVSCGIFRAGRGTTVLDTSKLSHAVNYDQSAKKSFFRIFPRKGEIWAMYEGWKVSWRDSDIAAARTRMVEITSDYSDDAGIAVCGLTTVNGCLTIYQRQQTHDGFLLTRSVPKAEMLCFSHRVPAFVIADSADPRVPAGSWHLEGDALPLKNFR